MEGGGGEGGEGEGEGGEAKEIAHGKHSLPLKVPRAERAKTAERRVKTAERRARTANRVRERREECREERKDHLARSGLDRFRDAVRKLQGNKDLMSRLRRESQQVQEAELDALCFSMEDDNGDPEPDGPVPTMEEYLERLRTTRPVVA